MDKNDLELLLIEGYKLRKQEDLEINQDFENTVSDGLLDDDNDDTSSNDTFSINS